MCLTCSCPTVIRCGDQRLTAVMTDVSQYGAQFQVDVSAGDVPPRLEADETVALDIETPDGSSSCTAKVRWTETTDAFFYVGVEFTKLPRHEDDPFWALVDWPY